MNVHVSSATIISLTYGVPSHQQPGGGRPWLMLLLNLIMSLILKIDYERYSWIYFNILLQLIHYLALLKYKHSVVSCALFTL